MKNSLLLDLTSSYSNIALLNKDDEIIDFNSNLLNKNLSDILHSNVANLLEKNKVDQKNIKKIFLVNGPGSFTSMRIGSVFCKTWIELYPDVEFYTIDRFHYQKYDKCISLIKVSTDKFSVVIFDEGKQRNEPMIISSNELKKIKDNNKFKIINNEEETNKFKCFNRNINDFKKMDILDFKLEYNKPPC